MILVRNTVAVIENLGAKQKQGSNAFITGPDRYREVKEKQSNDSVKLAGHNSATLKSHGQQTKRFYEYQVNEY